MHTDTYCLKQRQPCRGFIETTWFSLVNLHDCVCAGSPAEQGNNPQGASDLQGSRASRAGAPGGLVFTFSQCRCDGLEPASRNVPVICDGAQHFCALRTRPIEGEVSSVKVAKQISEQVWNPEQSFLVSSGKWPENKQHKTSHPMNFRVRIPDLHYWESCLK